MDYHSLSMIIDNTVLESWAQLFFLFKFLVHNMIALMYKNIPLLAIKSEDKSGNSITI